MSDHRYDSFKLAMRSYRGGSAGPHQRRQMAFAVHLWQRSLPDTDLTIMPKGVITYIPRSAR